MTKKETLRDKIAIAALQAILTNDIDIPKAASMAYAYADDMLKERNRR